MYAIGPYVEGNLVLNLTRDGNPWGYLLFDGPLVYHLPDSTYLPSPTYCIIPTEVDSRGHPLVSASPTRLTYDPPAPARRNSVDDDD